MHPGTIGGIVGIVLGIVGATLGILGGLGCFCSIKNTDGPRKRSFMIKASIICFVGFTIFSLGQLFLSTQYPLHTYCWFLFVLYDLLKPFNPIVRRTLHKETRNCFM